MGEILAQAVADMQIRYDVFANVYIAKIGGREREFETIEQAVKWCCKVRDQGGKA